MSRRNKLLMRALRRHEKAKRQKRTKPLFYESMNMRVFIGGVPFDIKGIRNINWEERPEPIEREPPFKYELSATMNPSWSEDLPKLLRAIDNL